MLKFNPEVVRELMKKKGMKQTELSRLTGMDKSTIYRILSPKVDQSRGMSVSHLAKIAHALGTRNFNQFFTEEKEAGAEHRRAGRSASGGQEEKAIDHLRQSLPGLEKIDPPMADQVRRLLEDLEK
jgi:transcriptional regulator with XRE-family HTH domain